MKMMVKTPQRSEDMANQACVTHGGKASETNWQRLAARFGRRQHKIPAGKRSAQRRRLLPLSPRRFRA